MKSKLLAVALATLALISTACGGDGSSSLNPKPQARPADASTVFNFAGAEFVRRYEQPTGEKNVRLSRGGGAHCDTPKPSGFRCSFTRAVPDIPDTETWVYDVHRDEKTGCWTARTHLRYGANEEDVQDYRYRRTFAPSKREVRKLIREADSLRQLNGCIPKDAMPQPGEKGSQSLARLASQGVARDFPGEQADTRCVYKHREDAPLIPPAYIYSCHTALKDGR